jgi:hypothetical protein
MSEMLLLLIILAAFICLFLSVMIFLGSVRLLKLFHIPAVRR